ncbi:MAG: hypothetical protein ACI4UA_05910 [Bacteroidaceae bacterium]
MIQDTDTNIPHKENIVTPSDAPQQRKMNSAQLQRLRESRRLAETKLRHVEESLKRLQKQQEWLRRHKELQLELQQQKELLFTLKKQQTTLDADRMLLMKHEQVENILKKVIRLSILRHMSDENKSEQNALEQKTEKLTHRQDELVKQKKQVSEQRKLAEEHFAATHDNTFQGCKMEGMREAAETEMQYLVETREKVRRTAAALTEEISKHRNELELVRQELERHRAGRQSMEMHEPMLLHTEAILLRLDLLLESRERQEELLAQQQETSRKQQDENQALARLYTQYRELVSQSETLEAELHIHRNNTKGQNSYDMQERAMTLKGKRQMLLSAESLWKRISAGYNSIEESEIRINELRLHIEHTEANIKALETETGKAQRISHEKEYTYLLSKGQNVVQLRAGLREGTACSVCGAKHHPYHCDTMLEQSKLISDFKTDYELLEAEVQGKLKQLEELRLDLAESKGERKAVEDTLEKLRITQNEYVREWTIYATLDRSFYDCSASTNQEARQAMIRQLQENVGRDYELAQKELDTFTFHHTQIAALSEKLQQLEQRKSELSTRLEEVNTACQVMAGRVERIQTHIDKERKRYSRIYEQTDKAITLTDWLREWKESHEGLKGHIQQMSAAWETVNGQIERETQEQAIEQTILDELSNQQNIISLWAEELQKRIEDCQTKIEENTAGIERLTGESDPRAQFRKSHEQLLKALSVEMEVIQEAEQVQSMSDRARGKNDFRTTWGQVQSEMMADIRAEIDVWIHNYNSQNSPIQFSELEKMITEERDWNELRSHILSSNLETALCQERVDNLNSRIVHLQAEGGKASNNEEEILASLAAQQELQEQQRRNIMLEIAKTDILLESQEGNDVQTQW